MKHQENVKKWFETHDKPSEQQFYNFFKWIRWIDENISVQDIEGLNKLLIAKADKQAFNTHLQDEILHPSENDRENWNGKLDKTGTSVNSLKLGDKLPSYYVAKQDVYNKQESDNALLLAMNEVVQMLLNNPDLEINSIQELLSEMTTADNALITSIANKVSYVVFQNVSLEQQKIAQKNIGLLNHNHYILDSGDARIKSIKPVDTDKGLGFYLSKNTINNQGVVDGDYVDLLVMNSWSDYTAKKINALSFSKVTKSIKLFQAERNADVWEEPIEVITNANISDYLPPTITPEQSQEIINNKENLNNHTHETLVIPRSEAPRNPVDYPREKLSLEFSQHLNSNVWDSAITVKGYSGFFGTWQLLSNASLRKAGDLFFRSGHSGNWGPLLRIYHSGNLPKQTVKPLSSVTTYTAKASDVGNIVPLSNENTQIILNTESFPRIGDTAKYFYKGTGTCKVAISGSANELCNINDTLEFDGQNSMIEITKTGANEYFVCGQLIRA
ncbi:hypothetical protein F7646_11415 [Tenacibaculum finnmarkense genomovar finnmarkense]|uniref:hypothetical protein n=2 Tax=Tenacibaculum finnmarkense TaxID=2781243 RepID=UPI00187BBF1C|nr:hypothetical protein [Tenacibaculum finnmarkense]MBE7661186.1 hypothetical protein [Tenacibaculum finnmarkense genomovar finnmarkense]